MSKKITKDSTVEEIMMQLGVGEGEELRTSHKRKNGLEKFAQLRSRKPETTLEIEDTHTAFVEVEEEMKEFLNITITSRQFEQQVSDLPQKYHDFLVQRAMTAHEVGHILYSSYPVLDEYMEKSKKDELAKKGVDEKGAEQYTNMFKFFYNAIEDGAIEKYLAENYRLEEELNHLRATLHEAHYFGREYEFEDGTEYNYPMYYAIITAAINLGVYDNGELDKLLDEDNEKHKFPARGGDEDRRKFINECLPLIRNEILQIHNESDARARTDRIYELWKKMREFIDDSVTGGKTDFSNDQENAEGDTYVPGVPENLSSGHGEQGKEPIVGSGDDESDDGGDSKSFGEKRGEGRDSSDSEQKAEEGIISEAKQEGNDWSDEIEEIINALGAGDGIEELIIAEDGEVNQSRMEEAKNLSRRTSRLFERRLRHMRKDKTVRGKERGKFDSRALIPAERGSTRVFKQTKPGNNRDYSCMIVLDRSSSMKYNVENVELAAGAIAWGLEDNGIDTCILDTENSQTTLSKPFGTKTENFDKKIFAGRCSGGTPITGTVKFARQRMKRGGGKVPFMIIITDGKPANKKSFKEQVRKANFPVLGLYLNDNKDEVDDQLSLYDKSVVAGTDEDINQTLINLINKIIF